MSRMLRVHFWDVDTRLEGENHSKLLDPRSELGEALLVVREQLLLTATNARQVLARMRRLHIELIPHASLAGPDELVIRARLVEGLIVDRLLDRLKWVDNVALVLDLSPSPAVDIPALYDIPALHITVHYYGPRSVPLQEQQTILSAARNILVEHILAKRV